MKRRFPPSPTPFSPISITPLSPPPSDLSISSAVTPKEINKVIQECCIAPGDVSLYGKHMAKIDIGLSHSQSPGGQSNTTSLPGGLGKYGHAVENQRIH